MIITPAEIQTSYWSLSPEGLGHLVVGADDVSTCLATALLTIPGSAALAPEFGSDLFQYIDYPTPAAALAIKQAIRVTAARWEPRANIVEITIEQGEGSLIVSVVFSAAGELRTLRLPLGAIGSQAIAPAVVAFQNPETREITRRQDWMLSRRGFGQIVQGPDEISESMYNIFATIPGSQALAPEFGSRLFEYISTPLQFAANGCKQAMREAVERWERRVIISRIDHEFYAANDDAVFSGIRFFVYWRLRDGGQLSRTELLFGSALDFLQDDGGIVPPVVPIYVIGVETGEALGTESGAAIEIE